MRRQLSSQLFDGNGRPLRYSSQVIVFGCRCYDVALMPRYLESDGAILCTALPDFSFKDLSFGPVKTQPDRTCFPENYISHFIGIALPDYRCEFYRRTPL